MQVLKEDIRDRILAISLEHFRENYIDRFYGTGQGMVRVHAAEASRNQYGGVRFHHPPAYGMDVHPVRGTADAFGSPTGNGNHLARLYSF